MLSSGILEAKNVGGKIMPRCPKCYSRNVEEQNPKLTKGIGIAAGAGLTAIGLGFLGVPLAGVAASKHIYKYKCKKCGHEFD